MCAVFLNSTSHKRCITANSERCNIVQYLPRDLNRCITAMLFKRGKIESKQDSTLLEDAALLDALMNNRAHGNTLIYPQIGIPPELVRKLKSIQTQLGEVYTVQLNVMIKLNGYFGQTMPFVSLRV